MHQGPHLQNPTREDLQKMYRKLERFEALKLQCEVADLPSVTKACEQIGYIGLLLSWPKLKNNSVQITCFKAKNGPCYDTGQYASYTGAALAALDDDAHLLFSDHPLPVCLKTAEIYLSQAYAKWTKVSAGQASKLERLQHDPLPFDCDDYEDSLKRLQSLITPDDANPNPTTCFYPGPFRTLILKSGHLLRRGQWCQIPKTEAKKLRPEGILTDTERNAPSVLLEHVLASGPTALLDVQFQAAVTSTNLPLQFEYLKRISPTLRKKLLHCIEKDTDHLLLTGSDPQDELGCCPSEEVGMANQLLRAGILQKAKQTLDAENCPIQIYTFRDELQTQAEGLSFTRNRSLREQILKRLQPSLSKRIFTWALFSFVCITLILSFTRWHERQRDALQLNLQNLIQTSSASRTTFVLFHPHLRCEMCLSMEQQTREFALHHGSDFILIDMDQPKWRDVVTHYQLFSASLFMLKHSEPQPEVTLIKEAWDSWRDKKAYRAILEQLTVHE